MFKPLSVVKTITQDKDLTHREARFLVNAVLHTDNQTGTIKASVELVANEVDIQKSNAYKMLKTDSMKKYLVVTTTTARRVEWSWQPQAVVATTTEQWSLQPLEEEAVVATTTSSGRDDTPSTSIYKEVVDIEEAVVTTTTEKKVDSPRVARASSSGFKNHLSSVMKEETDPRVSLASKVSAALPGLNNTFFKVGDLLEGGFSEEVILSVLGYYKETLSKKDAWEFFSRFSDWHSGWKEREDDRAARAKQREKLRQWQQDYKPTPVSKAVTPEQPYVPEAHGGIKEAPAVLDLGDVLALVGEG